MWKNYNFLQRLQSQTHTLDQHASAWLCRTTYSPTPKIVTDWQPLSLQVQEDGSAVNTLAAVSVFAWDSHFADFDCIYTDYNRIISDTSVTLVSHSASCMQWQLTVRAVYRQKLFCFSLFLAVPHLPSRVEKQFEQTSLVFH